MKYKDETIILIEYYQNTPHAVYTEYCTFDLNLHCNGWLMFHESGGGKNWKEKNGKKIFELKFQYCVPGAWKVWIDSQYILTPQLQKGITLLKKPLMLTQYYNEKEKHNNPFVISKEVLEIYWCNQCKNYFTEDGCPDHGKKYE